MEREILFRGKSQFTDHEWLYGSLLVLNKKFYVCPNQADKWNMTMFQVIEETLGQFTGLLDKNGKKIFEGDILRLDAWGNSLLTVRFVEGAFCLDDKTGYYTDIHYVQHAGTNQAVIIGNIHENKEE